MRGISRFRKVAVALLAVMLLAPTLPIGASAQETIYAGLNNCKTFIHHYQVQLNSHIAYISDDVFPDSVTLHFADGSTDVAVAESPVNIAGAKYYYLREEKGVEILTASTTWDTATYPNFTFKVTARPCVPEPEPDPTAVVSGTIVQNGNERPVADLDVCLVELGVCTVTDGDGSFSFGDVPNGTYTLTSDGNNWKYASTTVTVEGDTHVNLVQFKGGGNGK